MLEEARRIRDKYIKPPKTTDFAIMFLPVESLYAEVLKRPGLCERMQREFRVTPCGPTTLAALLNSLQMGFRTVAIERRTAQAAKAQRTTRVVIPRESGDEKNFDIPVIINGHTFLIQRGVPVEVPDMVLDVLMHAGLL